MRWSWALVGLCLAGAEAHAGTVAVLPFTETLPSEPHRGLGRALAALIVTDLVGISGLTVVERERVEELLREQSLVERGFVDPAQAAAAGRGLGAEALILGEYTVTGPRLVLTARVVDAQTGAVKVAAEASGPSEEFVDLEDALLARLVPAVAAKAKAKAGALTRDWGALVDLGEGLDAVSLGDGERASALVGEATAADPRMATALKGLTAQIDALRRAGATEGVEAQRQAARIALRTLPAERSRPAGFAHDPTTRLESAVRWLALEILDRPCERADEMAAFWAREHGRLDRRAYEQRDLHALLARFGFERLPAADGTPWGMSRDPADRSGELLDGPAPFLLDGDRWPSGQRSGWLHSLMACGDPQRTEHALASLRADLVGQTLNGIDGPAAVDALRWWIASRHADPQAVSASVLAWTEGTPPGSELRFLALSLAGDIGRAGDLRLRERRTRRGRSAAEVVARARHLAAGTSPWVGAEPLCAGIREKVGASLVDPLMEVDVSVADEERWPVVAMDRISAAVAFAEDFGCFADVPKRFSDATSAMKAWSAALPAKPTAECAGPVSAMRDLAPLQDVVVGFPLSAQGGHLWGTWGGLFYWSGLSGGCVTDVRSAR